MIQNQKYFIYPEGNSVCDRAPVNSSLKFDKIKGLLTECKRLKFYFIISHKQQ